ncbi:MAG: glycoside hydrolase family 3 N-terminal domain-containing protein [Phycisphaerae bacterium]
MEAMSLEEKLGQLTLQWGGEAEDTNPGIRKQQIEQLLESIRQGSVGAFLGAHGAAYTNRLQRAAVGESRLAIPLLFGNDVIHGYRTIFPIPLGEAASWSPDLVEQSCRIAASEARAAGTAWTFAPMIDICRDPRWGRVAEGAGEDPYLGSAMAAARVRGFQGDNLTAPDSLLACAKHFAAYGAAEGGRDYNTVDISERTLREIHLPPFKAAMDAGAGTMMSAFNEINGIPATANHLILRRILREEWNFDGFVVSDWTSITEMIVHGFAADEKDAAEKAIAAGVDMDMSSFSYRSHLAQSVREGILPEMLIDRAVRRVLRAKFALGLFDQPTVDPQLEQTVILSNKNRAIARKVARHAIVLLKNENGLLPLSDKINSLAVIGPLADNKRDVLGTWVAVGRAEDAVTVLEGIRRRLDNKTIINYARGCEVRGGTTEGFGEAIEQAEKSDIVILVVGESEDMSGEAYCRSTLDLPPLQQKLVEEIHGIGKPTVVLLVNGRPLSIGWIAENVPAIVETWQLGVETGHAVADVLFGDFNPGGKLPITFPRTVGQIPIYHSHKNTGRPPGPDRYNSKYIDIPSTPLYPFGHGLSYTEFRFGNLKVEPKRIGPAGRVRVSVEVENIGAREGDEVAQLYVRDLIGSVTRPVKELKGFRRIRLNPGEKKTVEFTLTHLDLGFYDRNMEFVVEPGVFKVWVGPNSVEGPESEFEVVARK